MSDRRPAARLVRIEDCVSVAIFDNPAPKCPHGKHWRESDYATAPAEARNMMCEREQCAAVEYHPHHGESIVLRTPRTFAARQPITELYALSLDASTAAATRLLSPEMTERMRQIIGTAVQEWTWTGSCTEEPYGICVDKSHCVYEVEPLPLPRSAWDVVSAHLTTSEMWWLVQATMAGGDPRAALATAGNSDGA